MKTSYSTSKSPLYKTRAVTKKKKDADDRTTTSSTYVFEPTNIGTTDIHASGDPSVNLPEPDPKLSDITNDVSNDSRVTETESVEEITEDVEEEVCNNEDLEYAIEPIDLTEDINLSPVDNNGGDAAVYPWNVFEVHDIADNPSDAPIFLQEPFKTVHLVLKENDIKCLEDNNWLSTRVIDFLIKYGVPLWSPSDVLVPTCNIEPLLDYYNLKAKSDNIEDIKFVEVARNKYKHFSTKPHSIFSISCQQNHFFVIEMIFHANDMDGDFFQWIKVYDSMPRITNKKNRIIQLPNPSVKQLLIKYQEFFTNYILYDTDKKELLNDPEYILQDVTYCACPIQENTYDC